MLVKEADEYAKKQFSSFVKGIQEIARISFRKGAEFSYNKAKEFHYCKNGLPEKEKYVLIYTEIKNVYMARLVKDDYFITKEGGFVQTNAVIAWKEIVLPRVEK